MSDLDIEVIPIEDTQKEENYDGGTSPGSSTSYFIPTENDESRAEGHFVDDNSEDEDDGVELVEIVSDTADSNCGSPCFDEIFNGENEELHTESMETSSAMETNSAAGTSSTIILKGSKDYSQWESKQEERRAVKRKSYCLEDECTSKSSKAVEIDETTMQTTEENNSAEHGATQGLKIMEYQLQCINFHCESGYDLVEAPVFVLTYFGETRKKNVSQRVCKECFKIALRHQKDVIFRLKSHRPLFGAKLPVQQEVVVMDHSEEKYEEELLPEEVVEQVRKYLPELLTEAVEKYDLDFQLDQANHFLTEKFGKLEAKNKLINNELDGLEKTLREARTLIYKDFVPKMKVLPSVHITEQDEILETGAIKIVTHNPPEIEKSASKSHDIVSVEEIEVPQDKIPPVGPLTYPVLSVGDPVYIMRNTFFSAWVKGRILEIISRDPEPPNYRVLFDTTCRLGLSKIVTGKQLAYIKPSDVRYPVGTRVVALFKNLEPPFQAAFYVGLIAEPPKHINEFRYLVFFDDGYAQYVPHESILLVCECSKLIHEDIHPDSREFIKNYLDRYPERPMVKLQQGQVVRTECDGKWWIARVEEIDGSLAKLYFIADNRVEWIYRGSTRLGPLYSELIAAAARQEQGALSRHRSLGISSLKKKNMPYVEYSVDQDDVRPPNTFTNINKNVAKKATSSRMNTEESSVDKNADPTKQPEKMEHTTKGYIRTIDLSSRIIGRSFDPHECDSTCTEWTNYSETDCKGINPLAIPLFYGFERQTLKHKGKVTIMYRAPCGKRLRTMMEVHAYLSDTNTPMGVDLFDFDDTVRILDEFYLDSDMCRTYLEDISYGLERNPVSCVNEIGHFWPVFMDYSTSRIPMEGVNICLDEEFLVCCSCTDDCQDKQKCECWQLTFEGTKLGPEGISDPSVGYQYKRLLEPVTTGIYECNKRCKCSSTCFNRVAQCPLKLNLQVFRTLKKGWGLRTINDIPEGGFICIYAGRLHTEQSANNDGRMYGDEYLAELDYIEVVERFKEGYESEVVEPTEKNEEDEDDNEKSETAEVNMDDKDYVPEGLNKLPQTENVVNTRARQKKFSSEEKSEGEGEKEKEGGENEDDIDEDDDEMKKKPSKFSAKVPDEEPPRAYKSVREMFGDGADDCYVMDAKSVGNIGRYLNHSCQPNVFVQNVFVDTHDVRFPWVAFFALTHIKAGTELTWDYNYDIGSVPDKDPYQNVEISRRGAAAAAEEEAILKETAKQSDDGSCWLRNAYQENPTLKNIVSVNNGEGSV